MLRQPAKSHQLGDEEVEKFWRTVLRGPLSSRAGLGVSEVVEKITQHLGGFPLAPEASALLDQRDFGKVTLEGFKLFVNWFGLDDETPNKVNAILDFGFGRPTCYYNSEMCNQLLQDAEGGSWVLRYSQSADEVLFAISRKEENKVIHRKVFFVKEDGFCLNAQAPQPVWYLSLHELLIDAILEFRLLPKSYSTSPPSTSYISSSSSSPPCSSSSPSLPSTTSSTAPYTLRNQPQHSNKWEIPSSELVKDKMVGKGSFGEVYKGRWRGATVAIKVMVGVPKLEEVLQFKNEAALLANLRPHSNVVQFFGVSEMPNLSIVTEFLEGGSLDHLLKLETFNNRQLVRMAGDIAAGILHLHKEGIIHRDLAARNLLVKKIQGREESYYEVKVTDFGLSRTAMTGTTKADMPVKWSAPESLMNGSYSFASDVWSYGIVLWEMLHQGEEPYNDMTVIQIFEGVTKRGLRPPVPSSAPQIFKELMYRCWALNPEDRPDFEFLNQAVSEVLEQGNLDSSTSSSVTAAAPNSASSSSSSSSPVSTVSNPSASSRAIPATPLPTPPPKATAKGDPSRPVPGSSPGGMTYASAFSRPTASPLKKAPALTSTVPVSSPQPAPVKKGPPPGSCSPMYGSAFVRPSTSKR